MTNFILLFEGRTGSTYIMDSLNSHPNVVAKGELLVRKNAAEQEEIIRNLYNSKCDNIIARGFKTKLRDIADRGAFLDLINEFNVKIIFMYRQNLVRLALSRLNAKRLFAAYGTWNLVGKQDILPPFSPTIDEFEDALNFRRIKEEELKAFMATINREILVRDYQDLLDSHDELFNDYFAYIGVNSAALNSKIKKNTDNDMRKVLLNYDDIKAYYSDSIYAEMFDD